MVVALLFIGIISGLFAALCAWIFGYGIGAMALAYWSVGSAATLLYVGLKVFLLSHRLRSAPGHQARRKSLRQESHAKR